MKFNKTLYKNGQPKDYEIRGFKLLLFKCLAILAPLIFLFLFELFLRVFNYGDDTSLFIKYPLNKRFMVMNYLASEKFFPDTANSTVGNQELFAVKKSPNTFRIFVLGESTTIGYPFNPNGSFHRWLQYRLTQMYPDINFEVINLSLTAVNSYTVLDFGKQLAPYHPDAVLIYTGHNEYYGALGIGSTTYVGSNRLLVQTLIRLRELRLVQLFNNCIKKITSLFSRNKPVDRASLMEALAARQHIAYGSNDYEAGIEQFDKNMTELCSTLNDEKIPVFLSTIVSNEKDLAPFISQGTGPGSAAWYYNAGRSAFQNGSFDLAKNDFLKAKELDQLRFRAPEAINHIIIGLANQFKFIHLVDTKKLFEQSSPHRIVGNELMMEHVHPNLMGYALMSEAFYEAMQKQHLPKGDADRNMTFNELLAEMPITRMDSLKGKYQIMMLETGWPFNKPIPKQFKVDTGIESALAVKVALGHLGWTNAMGQLFRYDKKLRNLKDEVKVTEAMVLQYPQSEEFYGFSGNLNVSLKNYNKAAFYYKKLYLLNNDQQLADMMFTAFLKADNPDGALRNISYTSLQKKGTVRNILLQIMTDKALLASKPEGKNIKQEISNNYKQLGINELAVKYAK